MGNERNSRGGEPGDYYSRNAAEDYGAGRDDYGRERNYRNQDGRDQGDYGYGRTEYRPPRRVGVYGDQQRGWTSEDRYGDRDRGRDTFPGGRDEGRGGRGAYGTGRDEERDFGRDGYRQQHGGSSRQSQSHDEQDRGFMARAGDEVRSWFGDEEAERRREADARHSDHETGRSSYGRDEHYHNWRSEQLAQFDRDYHEYRQENQSKFHSEFAAFRSERQGQRDLLSKVTEHVEVVGSDGEHVGTVDKVRGDRIVLTKNDADAGGRHHSIPSRWLQSADGGKVTLRKTASEAQQHWRDEEQREQGNKASFGDRDRDERQVDQGSTKEHPTNLNRSFSGTY